MRSGLDDPASEASMACWKAIHIRKFLKFCLIFDLKVVILVWRRIRSDRSA